VLWLKRLVAGLSPRRLGFSPGQSVWDLWWTKWQWDGFISKFFGFPLSMPFHRRSPYSYIIWGGWTICPLVAAVQRRSLIPSKSTIYVSLTDEWHWMTDRFRCLFDLRNSAGIHIFRISQSSRQRWVSLLLQSDNSLFISDLSHCLCLFLNYDVSETSSVSIFKQGGTQSEVSVKQS
jgi:hypothetical protein